MSTIVSTASTTLSAREGRADDVADAGVLVGAAAEGDLVEFLALLVDAENADMADMVMAAGIDAAGDLDLELADLALALGIGKAAAEPLGDRDRAGIGEAAIVQAGAGDDVADQADIGGGEADRGQTLPQRRQSRRAATCGSTRFCSWVTRISPKL